MSAFAFSYGRDKIVVAADSLGYIPHRDQVIPLGFISKVLPLPHIKAVMFSRGQYQILVCAMAELLVAPHVTTVEAAAEALPDLLRAATLRYCDQQGIDDPTGAALLEVTFCGWSPIEGRMRLWQYLSYENYAAHNEGDETYMLHAWPSIPEQYKPALNAAMPVDMQLSAIVQGIGKWFVDEPETNCGMRIGGEIIATEVTPRGLSQRVIHRFADYTQHLRAGVAVSARILRGDMDVSRAVADGLVPVTDMVDPDSGDARGDTSADVLEFVSEAVPPARQLSRQQRRQAERAARKTNRRVA